MNAVIVICSTLASRRVPRKAVKLIAGVPVIEHILTRVSKSNIPVLLAVPTGAETLSVYKKHASKFKNVKIYQGEDDSPLHRMASAVRTLLVLPEYIIRITHDDILIDCREMLKLLNICTECGAGYGVTKGIFDGAGVEVIATDNLLAAADRIKHPVEHISYFVNRAAFYWPTAPECRGSIARPYRLTLDYHEDAIILEAVLRKLGPFATNDAICAYLDDNKKILEYNRMPELTLYTCVYNNAQYLRRTVESILDIGPDINFEYIIVNDGSSNDTLLEIVKIANEYPGMIKVISNETNIGLASSSNVALKEARGRYIMRVDADDLICDELVRTALSVIQFDGAAAVYSNFDEINANGKLIRGNVRAQDNHHVGCALMDKKIINEIKFKEGLRHWDSLELYNRLSPRFEISYIDKPLWNYRRHSECISMNNLKARAAARRKI